MSDIGNNPNLIEQTRATRFGQPGGPDPSKAATLRNKVRGSLQRLACLEFDIDRLPQSPAELHSLMGEGKRKLRGAELIAASKFIRAYAGNPKLLQQVTDDIDGKQANAPSTLTVNFNLGDAAREAHRRRMERQRGAGTIDGSSRTIS